MQMCSMEHWNILECHTNLVSLANHLEVLYTLPETNIAPEKLVEGK